MLFRNHGLRFPLLVLYLLWQPRKMRWRQKISNSGMRGGRVVLAGARDGKEEKAGSAVKRAPD